MALNWEVDRELLEQRRSHDALKQQKNEPALRYDAGKPRFDLLPSDALEEIAAVFAHGAEKYGDSNWLNGGMSWRRCLGSLLRHVFAWAAGRDLDDGPGGSGLPHMAHAAVNCIFLLTYAKRKLGTDDRLKEKPNAVKA